MTSLPRRLWLLVPVLIGGIVVTGCEDELPLAIEQDQSTGFDPLRFSAGQEPAGELPDDGLRFSITPFYTPERQQEMLERMRAWLEQRTGVPVKATVSKSYEAAVQGLASGDLDVAQLSPYACVKVQGADLGIELIATTIAQGTHTYASYFVVRSDSELSRLEDAKGKRLALTEPWSASGFLYPWAWLRRHGLDPAKDFNLVVIPKHDAALQAVLDGRVDVAAVSSDTLVSRGVLGMGGPVRIIAKAGRVPYDCIAVRKAAGERVAWRLKKAFLELSILTPAGRAVLRDYNLINGFIPLPAGHYDDVKALDEAYGSEVARAAESIPVLEPVPVPPLPEKRARGPSRAP